MTKATDTPSPPLDLSGKRVLITGATGSLGRALLRRLSSGAVGVPARLVLFSRDEAKQHDLRLEYLQKSTTTDEVIYDDFARRVEFRIGDVRDFQSVAAAMRDIDIVFNAAALKQVPTCEYFPYEAVLTNVGGANNIARAIGELKLPVETVVGVSTDKACKPINVMGMTKALQERIFVRASLDCPATRFVIVRYGNVLASRGSVIPLFLDQIRSQKPLTVTDRNMTRFLLSLDDAVDVIFAALSGGRSGEIFVPHVPAARMVDVATALIGNRPIKTEFTGIRPGEKLHEVLVTEEERFRTRRDGRYYVIMPMLPELRDEDAEENGMSKEYSSADETMTLPAIRNLLEKNGLTA